MILQGQQMLPSPLMSEKIDGNHPESAFVNAIIDQAGSLLLLVIVALVKKILGV